MARTKQDVEALIRRMGGPQSPELEVVVTSPNWPPYSYLEWWRRDGRLQHVFLIHPFDLDAAWEDHCSLVAHELGHSEDDPPGWSRLGIFWQERLTGTVGRILMELAELATGRVVRREIGADRRSIKYLNRIGYGLPEVLNRYRHDAQRFRHLPRLLRWLALFRLWRQKKLLLLQLKPHEPEALWV